MILAASGPVLHPWAHDMVMGRKSHSGYGIQDEIDCATQWLLFLGASSSCYSFDYKQKIVMLSIYAAVSLSGYELILILKWLRRLPTRWACDCGDEGKDESTST